MQTPQRTRDSHALTFGTRGEKVITIDGDMCKTTTTPKSEIIKTVRWW